MPTQQTVFYAWQSWAPPAITRNVIEDALKRALKRTGADTGTSYVLDRDTKSVPGAPHIPDTIREKIASASAVVADLTPVVRSTIAGRTHDIPNPNVMFEVGCAVEAHDWEALILIMNSALGDPQLLPFDLGKHRLIVFDLAPQAKGETEDAFRERRSAVRKRLVSDMAKALELIEQAAIANAAGSEQTEEWVLLPEDARLALSVGARDIMECGSWNCHFDNGEDYLTEHVETESWDPRQRLAAVELLIEDGYMSGTALAASAKGNRYASLSLTESGFRLYAQNNIPDFGAIELRILRAAVSLLDQGSTATSEEIAQASGVKPFITEACLRWWTDAGAFQDAGYDGRVVVHSPSQRLRRGVLDIGET